MSATPRAHTRGSLLAPRRRTSTTKREIMISNPDAEREQDGQSGISALADAAS